VTGRWPPALAYRRAIHHARGATIVQEGFQYLGKLSEMKENEPWGLQISGELAVAARVGDRVYVLGGHCPHTGMRLADGVIAEGRLVCFYHGAN
jgi:phenylpropionate dioxygenase-like ring-hydroxylating dioxygenase large terminal subunit